MASVDPSIDYLLDLPRFADRGGAAYRPGLSRIRTLLEAMGNPHLAYRICHVGGTNGKGSTASMVAAILTASGIRTGLHTSPHLLHVTERMRVDGSAVEETWLSGAVERYRSVFEHVGPSFFEATVALSLLYFAEEGVDAAVIEVGLGGRLDATNIVTPDVCVITNVGLEHTDILGDTIERIAFEKAGIIKSGVPVVTGAEGSAATVIADIAAERSSPLTGPGEASVQAGDPGSSRPRVQLQTARRDYGWIELDLPGPHQITNACLAVLAAEHMVTALDPEAVRRGLGQVRALSGLRGRLEQVDVSPPVIVDVAHNADGIAVAAAYAANRAAGGRLGIVLSLMKDKDADAVARALVPHRPVIRTVPLAGDRAMAANDLAGKLKSHGLQASPSADVSEASAELRGCGVILVAGSHLLAAEVLAGIRGD